MFPLTHKQLLAAASTSLCCYQYVNLALQRLLHPLLSLVLRLLLLHLLWCWCRRLPAQPAAKNRYMQIK